MESLWGLLVFVSGFVGICGGSERLIETGSAITAYFLACNVSAEGEPYFVDPVYRPNPDDYQVCVLCVRVWCARVCVCV